MLNNRQKVIKGLSTQSVITIISGVLEIVSFSIMSRLLSQKDFGYYAAIIAISSVFISLTETGIGSSLVQKKDLDKKYINSAFSLSFIFGVVISGTLCLLSGLLAKFVADETMTFPLRLFSATLLCNCLTSVNMALLQRELRFIKIGVIKLTSFFLTTAIAIFLAVKGMGYYAILTKAVLQSVIILLFSFLAVKVKYSFVYDKTEFKKIFNFGGWLMFSALFRNLSHQVDKLLMTNLFSIETLGMYTRPKEFISRISDKFNSIFDSVLFPVLSTIQDDNEKLQNSFFSAVYFLNMFGMLIALSFFCNSELLIRIFFSEEWLNTNGLFMTLSVYPVFLINGRLSDVFLRSVALTKQQFFFRVGQFVLAVAFIFVGYRSGIIAVAVSIMFSYFTITAIKICYFAKKINIRIRDIVAKVLKSFRFVLYVIPIYLLCRTFLPHTWTGNIIQSVIFTTVIAIIFLAAPKLVGEKYKIEIHSKIISFINTKVLKRK